MFLQTNVQGSIIGFPLDLYLDNSAFNVMESKYLSYIFSRNKNILYYKIIIVADS